MKILLYGGTFDPPHIGHINNLRAAAAAVRPDKIIVMPAGTPPHKAASETPGALRLAMCACFVHALDDVPCDRPDIILSDWEIRQSGRSYTVNTLEMLCKQYPAAKLYLCVGSDMLATFTAWHRWRDILQMAALVVESRSPGDEGALELEAQALRGEGGQVIVADTPPVRCSSTEIRAEIRAGSCFDEELRTLLAPETETVIRGNHLYGL